MAEKKKKPATPKGKPPQKGAPAKKDELSMDDLKRVAGGAARKRSTRLP